jgi:hypothetical protein
MLEMLCQEEIASGGRGVSYELRDGGNRGGLDLVSMRRNPGRTPDAIHRRQHPIHLPRTTSGNTSPSGSGIGQAGIRKSPQAALRSVTTHSTRSL